jgi:ABC-type uncharacterized transport system involved in gliding motility auxiliary subunit
MKLDRRSRLNLRLQNSTFTLLILIIAGLLAWLSTHYTFQADWTANKRHSLSETSRLLLQQMAEPLSITAYASTRVPELRASIRNIVERYQQHKSDISLHFIDPLAAPGEVEERGITADGEMILSYQGRDEHLAELTETAFSQTLQRLIRREQRWIVFLQGHGERDPLGRANSAFGNWTNHLQSRGFQITTIDFNQAQSIPDNTSVLVLTMPEIELLPGELDRLKTYIDNGGNLLWLLERGEWHGLETLTEMFGISRIEGMPMDPDSSRQFGYQHRSTLLVSDFGNHPLTRTLQGLRALMPEPVAFNIELPDDNHWQTTPLFHSRASAWVEAGDPDSEHIAFDADQDTPGPLLLGSVLTRDMNQDEENPQQQRVAIIGDSDFVSNAYLDNSINLDLGLSLLNWLAEDDNLLNIPALPPSDFKLDWTQATAGFVAFSFLFVIPLLLLTTGGVVWWRRRKR